MSGHDPIADVRARLAPHGYNVFLVPARPAGWTVVMSGRGLERPLETRAGSREEALASAESLFVNRRMQDLDAAIRGAGHQPPGWSGTIDEHLVALEAYARQQGIPA